MGRPSLYTPELAERILDQLADGRSIVEICRAVDMPSARTVHQWAADNPDFSQNYARAREVQAEFMDQLVMDVAEKAGDDPQAAKVKIDAYKWRAAHLAPKKYGSKLDLTTGGDKIGRETSEVEAATRLAALAVGILGRGENEPSD